MCPGSTVPSVDIPSYTDTLVPGDRRPSSRTTRPEKGYGEKFFINDAEHEKGRLVDPGDMVFYNTIIYCYLMRILNLAVQFENYNFIDLYFCRNFDCQINGKGFKKECSKKFKNLISAESQIIGIS